MNRKHTFSVPSLVLGLALLAPVAPALASDGQSWPEMVAEHDKMTRTAQGDSFKKKRKRHKRKHRMSSEEREELRGEVQRKVQTFITVELASRLELNEATALKLSGAIKAHQERSEATKRATRDEYKKLKELLEDGGASDSALRAQTKKVVAAANERAGHGDLFDDTARFLSAEQQAKLVLSFPHVRKEMRRMMHHAKKRARGQGRGERRGDASQAPDEPMDDDDLE